MPQREDLVPCPLGASCSAGGRHYPSSQIYKDHARAAASPGGKAGAGKQSSMPVKYTGGYMHVERLGTGLVKATTPAGSVTISNSTAKLLEASNEATPPVESTPTWATTSRLEDELNSEGYSPVGTRAARSALNIEAASASVSELFSDAPEVLKEVIDRQEFNSYDGGDADDDAYSLAPELWHRFEMRTERIESMIDAETMLQHGKVTVSANVDGYRREVEFDLPVSYSGNAGKEALVEAIEFYTYANGNADTAREFATISALDGGGIDTALAEHPELAEEWSGLTAEERRARFVEEFDEAYEEMSEIAAQFESDRLKIKELLSRPNPRAPRFNFDF